MELKTNYQYTYFIHPFIINKGKYQKYILKMLKDKNFKLKIFEKEKDIRIYKYFLPKTRETLFSSFSFTNTKYRKLEELPLETRAALLSKYNCNIFECNLKRNIQGKINDKNGIFFNIEKIEVICFDTGICFLTIKTNLEGSNNFDDVLNFNYKFRDINSQKSDYIGYDNIRIQTDSFADVEKFQEFIQEITGTNIEAEKIDIETERFFTYSYSCIDQDAWNQETVFESLQIPFIKYANILPADNNRDYEFENVEIFSKWKYAKIGVTKQSITMFTSTKDMNNYTILPDEYENQYLYTYILNLYKKIYLKKLEFEFKDITKIKQTRKKFIEFTKNIWMQELTEDETGSLLNHKLHKVFETHKIYEEVKNRYDILYKELNIEKNRKTTIIISVILAISLIFNILNFIILMK